jgi:hypothetical protein
MIVRTNYGEESLTLNIIHVHLISSVLEIEMHPLLERGDVGSTGCKDGL